MADIADTSYRLDRDNPWPGLAWFDETAEEFFNGRSREIAELKRLVSDAPLTVLFGRSGLGKTSLLKAGLFPALRRANFLPVYVRVRYGHAGELGAPPLIEQLYSALVDACQSEKAGADAPPRTPGDSLWEYLHRTDTKIWSRQNQKLVPVFVLDQFEEVFTLGQTVPLAVQRLREDLADLAENRIPVATERRLAADPELATSFALRSQPYRVLMSFREDFATDFERWRELPSLMRNRLQLLPMTGRQAFDAILGSASHIVDAPTAALIVRFVASEKKSNPQEDTALVSLDSLTVEPALLSLVCRGLNEGRKERRAKGGADRIDIDLLSQLGAGVVDRHYNDSMSDQPERVSRFIENELITESGFCNPCAQDDAMREPYNVTLGSLQVLVDRRLLRFEPSLGVTRVELIHDLLAPTVVKHRDERRRYDQMRRVSEEMRRQDEARRAADAALDARRRSKIAATVAGGAIVALLAVGALASYAFVQARAAERARAVASQEARIAKSRELASAAMIRLDTEPELAVRLAVEAGRFAQTLQAESALRQALFRWHGHADDPLPQAPSSAPILHLRGVQGAEPTDDVMSVAISPDGRRLLGVGCDRIARVWEVVSGRPVFAREHPSPLTAGAFSADGTLMLTAGGNPCLTHPTRDVNDTDIRVWDARTGDLRTRLVGPQFLLVGAAFDATGARVFGGGLDGRLLSWRIADGAMHVVGDQTSGLEPAIIQAVERSPDGLHFASAAQDGTVAIWNATTGARERTLSHDFRVLALAYGGSPGGEALLATVDENGVAKLWDAATYSLRRELRTYTGALYAAALSRDGRFLVTAGTELALWETQTGAKMQVIASHDPLYAVAMSGDGRAIAAAGQGGFLQIFDCDICTGWDNLLALAESRPPRDLTEQERKELIEEEKR